MHRVKLQIILIGIANKTPEQTTVIKSVELKNDEHRIRPYNLEDPTKILLQKKRAARL
jgi:hypothetical protein